MSRDAAAEAIMRPLALVLVLLAFGGSASATCPDFAAWLRPENQVSDAVLRTLQPWLQKKLFEAAAVTCCTRALHLSFCKCAGACRHSPADTPPFSRSTYSCAVRESHEGV